MDSYYGYSTAVWYWRIVAPRNRAPRHISRMLERGTYAFTSVQEYAQRPKWLDARLVRYAGGIDQLVFHDARRSARGDCRQHLWRRAPRDAFSPAGEKSFVSSPEFCFLQMASELSFVELALLGMELCGLYCIDPDEAEGIGERTVPLTSTARLRAFLANNEGARGRRAAEVALQYIEDGSASPMESAIYLLLCLPVKRGGYALPRPKLNHRIDLDEDAAKLAGKSWCYGDLCWPDDHLDLEYLGEGSHEGRQNMLADRSRTLAIEEMGFEVVEITKEQACDLDAFDIIAKRVAKKLGKRLQKGQCGATEPRKRLFREVYCWQSDILDEHEAEMPDDTEEGGPVYGRGTK